MSCAHPRRPDCPVITIDGPSASGKGTLAARVAAALGFHYLDSGALYRLVRSPRSRPARRSTTSRALAQLARGLAVAFSAGAVRLGGRDVTEALRTEAVSAAASQVAASRRGARGAARAPARLPPPAGPGRRRPRHGLHVFPRRGAQGVLTASVDTRAERRYKQLIEKGIYANNARVVADLRRRDARDASRAVAPLRHYRRTRCCSILPGSRSTRRSTRSSAGGAKGRTDSVRTRPPGVKSPRVSGGCGRSPPRGDRSTAAAAVSTTERQDFMLSQTQTATPTPPPRTASPPCSRRACRARKCASAK